MGSSSSAVLLRRILAMAMPRQNSHSINNADRKCVQRERSLTLLQRGPRPGLALAAPIFSRSGIDGAVKAHVSSAVLADALSGYVC